MADGCALVLVAADGRVVPAVTDGRMDDGRDGRAARQVDEDFFLEAYGSVNLDRRG